MEQNPSDQLKARKISPRQWARMVFVYLFIPLVLFLCAGDFRWWQAWVFSLLIFSAGVGGRVLAERRHPGLMDERISQAGAENVKAWDRVLSPLMSVSIGFPPVIVAGLDHRFGWSPEFSLWLVVIGFILITVGYGFGVWALVENSFFSGVVRMQDERGHAVCDSGPYRIVRHPGYAGNLLALPGIALALGSVWTLIPAVIALIITALRTALEDRTLQEDLPGYRAYAGRVRYRLFPGIY